MILLYIQVLWWSRAWFPGYCNTKNQAAGQRIDGALWVLVLWGWLMCQLWMPRVHFSRWSWSKGGVNAEAFWACFFLPPQALQRDLALRSSFCVRCDIDRRQGSRVNAPYTVKKKELQKNWWANIIQTSCKITINFIFSAWWREKMCGVILYPAKSHCS